MPIAIFSSVCKRHGRPCITAMVFLTCFIGQTWGGDISIKNQNCVWQGLQRTNQAKFHVFQTKRVISRSYSGSFDDLPDRCTEEWITIRAGSTRTVKVEQFFDNESDITLQNNIRGIYKKVGPALDCFYSGVQAEGVIGGDQHLKGTAGQKIACGLDWAGVCQCRAQ
jgi:hypothetical protein